MSNKFGVGLIGYGIGRVHAHAWKNIPLFYDGSVVPNLVGFSARDPLKTAEMKESFDFEKSYSDWHDLVKDPAIQIIDNCSPPNLHLESCTAAAEAGKAVLCEKPLARSADEAYEMYKAAKNTGIVAMSGFTVRFAPAVMLAKNLIDSGKLGKIFSIRCCYMNIESGYNGYLDPNYPLHWHFDRKIAGHGAISDLGSHALDMACFLLGEVTEVCGATQTIVHERPLASDPSRMGKVTVDDVAVASLKFKSGALGTIDASWMASGKKDYFYFEVHGSEGSVRFNFERLTELEVYLKNGSGFDGYKNVIATSKKHPNMDKFWADQGGGFGWNHLFVVELKHFLDWVAKGEQMDSLDPTFWDGYINSLLIDSVVESSRSEKWVKIEPKVNIK
jgi:predicted dehydrogenase